MSDPAELPDIVGGWHEVRLTVGQHIIPLARPQAPDDILEDAATLEENKRDDYMPYWSWLWPAALNMAEIVGDIPLPARPVLEIGTGLGLVGIAGLLGGHDVILSDYRSESVRAARHNASINGFPEAEVRQIDWREPPRGRFASVLACDVLYEQSAHAPLLKFLERVLVAQGECWIGDPGRRRAVEFLALAADSFTVKLYDESLEPSLVPPKSGFFLIRLSRRA